MDGTAIFRHRTYANAEVHHILLRRSSLEGLYTITKSPQEKNDFEQNFENECP